MKDTQQDIVIELINQIQGIDKRLGTLRLTPAQRRALKGKWFAQADEFLARAAIVRDTHDHLLRGLRYGAAEIEAQRLRCQALHGALDLLEALTKRVADTLLHERVHGYRLATGVLYALEALYSSPCLSVDEEDVIGRAFALLRKHFDKKNKKISRTKRARGAKAPRPQLGEPVEPGKRRPRLAQRAVTRQAKKALARARPKSPTRALPPKKPRRS